MHRTNVAAFGRQRPGHTQNNRSCSNSTPHLTGHGPGRPVKTLGRPHGHGGRRSNGSSISSTPHLMGSGPGRPVETHGSPHGPGGAAHTEPTSHGPRPDPAHHISRGWAAARPGPSKLQRMGRGPAQPITLSNCHGPVRPGPSNFQKSRPGPARPITFSNVSARSGPARHNFQIGPAWPGPNKRLMVSPGIYNVCSMNT